MKPMSSGRRLSSAPAGADAAGCIVAYSRCPTATHLEGKMWEFIQRESRETAAVELCIGRAIAQESAEVSFAIA
jgi:hypothetical protein